MHSESNYGSQFAKGILKLPFRKPPNHNSRGTTSSPTAQNISHLPGTWNSSDSSSFCKYKDIKPSGVKMQLQISGNIQLCMSSIKMCSVLVLHKHIFRLYKEFCYLKVYYIYDSVNKLKINTCNYLLIIK